MFLQAVIGIKGSNESTLSYMFLYVRYLLILYVMAGLAGFEPARDDTKNRCLTAWL